MSNNAASNVIAMREFDRPVPSQQAAQFERLLKECQDLALERLSRSVAGMLDKVEDALWGLANQCMDRELRDRYIRVKDLALSAVGNEVRLARGARVAAGAAQVDVRALLDRVDFLAPVEPPLRDALAERARVVRFGRGEVVLRQGDTASNAFYVIAEGEVALRVASPDGGEREVSRLGPGEFFGEMGALTGDPGAATAVAERDLALVVVDRDAFAELFRRAPEAARKLAEVLAKRREGLERTVEKAGAGAARPAEPHQLFDRLRGIFKHLG